MKILGWPLSAPKRVICTCIVFIVAAHAHAGVLVKDVDTPQLPRIEDGDSNIDRFFGGVSSLEKEEILRALHSIKTSSPTYAFHIAMETMKPDLEKFMSQIRQYDDDNRASSALVGCLLPRCVSPLSLIQEIFSECSVFLEEKWGEDEKRLSQLQNKIERLSGYTDFFVSLRSDLTESFRLAQSDMERLEKISPQLEKLFLSLRKLLQGRSEKSGKALETDRKQSSRISDNKGEKKHES